MKYRRGLLPVSAPYHNALHDLGLLRPLPPGADGAAPSPTRHPHDLAPSRSRGCGCLHTAGWGRLATLFLTMVSQQAANLIALALGFGFLEEFTSRAAFEPMRALLLMPLSFVYVATHVPSTLGNTGTFDARHAYFGTRWRRSSRDRCGPRQTGPLPMPHRPGHKRASSPRSGGS